MRLSHRKRDERIIRGQHGEERATFHRVILLMHGTAIRVMEISRDEPPAADDEIAREDEKILRPHRMSWPAGGQQQLFC